MTPSMRELIAAAAEHLCGYPSDTGERVLSDLVREAVRRAVAATHQTYLGQTETEEQKALRIVMGDEQP